MKMFMNIVSYCLSLVCIVSIIATTITTTTVTAFPTGAGACASGKSSVGGTHPIKLLGRKVTSTKLGKAGVVILIDKKNVTEGNTISVAKDTSIPIKITGKNMKGINIRVGAPSGVSTTNVITPGKGLKLNSNCKSPSIGVTQKSATSVSSYTSTINFPTVTTGVVLDITIVFRNEISSAYHSYGKVFIDFE